jgi:hypothetical protein
VGEAVVLGIATIGPDLAKNAFQGQGTDGSGRSVFRNQLRPDQIRAFSAQLPCFDVAMDSCRGAQFWGR